MLLSKKVLVILVIIMALVLGGGVFLYFRSKPAVELPGSELINPDFTKEEQSQPETKEKLKEYVDEAGFSFSYPETLSIKEVANQDSQTYSALEVFLAKNPTEKLTIKVTDTANKDINEWVTKNRQTDWQVNEAVLAQMNGKLVKSGSKIILAAIKQEILFIIEAPNDSSGYWLKQINTIAQNFSLNLPTPKSSGQSTQSDIEEIIE